MVEKDINKQKLIYFYSPLGTWTRINKNLEILGLDKNKKIGNVYTKNFIDDVVDGSYKTKYKDYDVIYLDEFYSIWFDEYGELSWEHCYKKLKELIKSGKQIVMAGHGDLKTLDFIGKEALENLSYYELIYGTDIDTSIEYIE